MIRFTETIHKWMGWCPAKAGMTGPGGMQGYETKPHHVPGSKERIIEGRIIDYSLTRTPLWRLILYGVGIAAIVSFMKLSSLIFVAADMILLISFMLASAFVLTYNDKKRTNIEYGPGTLIIRRPLLKPVIIPKDQIDTMEIRENKHPLPHWLMAATALIIVPAYSVFGLYKGLLSWVSGGIATSSLIIDLGFFIILVLFVLSIYNYSVTRYRFPKIFVITTTGNKSLVIYAKNPEELAELQEKLL